jgi:hypothetical protein
MEETSLKVDFQSCSRRATEGVKMICIWKYPPNKFLIKKTPKWQSLTKSPFFDEENSEYPLKKRNLTVVVIFAELLPNNSWQLGMKNI